MTKTNSEPLTGCGDCRAEGRRFLGRSEHTHIAFRGDGKTVWYTLSLCGTHAAARGLL